MTTAHQPNIRFKTIFMSIMLALSVMVFGVVWAVHNYQQQQSIERVNQIINTQTQFIKTLLEPAVSIKNATTRTRQLSKAVNQIKDIWQTELATETNTSLFLSAPQNTQNPQNINDLILLSNNQLQVDIKALNGIIAISKTATNDPLIQLTDSLVLANAPVINEQFGLIVVKQNPSLISLLEQLAIYITTSIIAALFISWLLIKIWKHRTLKKINHSQARYVQFVENSVDWIWETDRHGNLVYSSNQSTNILGYTPEEVIGHSLFNYLLPKTAEQDERNISLYMGNGSNIESLEVHFNSKGGKPILMELNAQAYKDKNDKVLAYRGVCRDITQSKEHHDSMISMVYFDSLTQLPNRENLIQQLNKHLKEVVQRKDLKLSALLLIDLDDFKDINDLQGHETGDSLLKEISQRMQQFASQSNMVYRLSGDEFVILIKSPNKMLMPEFRQKLHLFIHELLHIIHQPHTVADHNALVSASVGIALIPQDGRTSSEILSHADSAMYQAKNDGKNCYRYFDASMQEQKDYRKQMAKEIKDAILNNEFELYYQLQIDSSNNEIYGMEALIRWPHPTRNAMISPAEFIQIAVDSNHIQAIDKWVIEQAASDIAKLQKATNTSIPVSINVSAKTLENPELPNIIQQQIDTHFLVPSDLRLEVTETSLLRNMDRAVETLEHLRERGVKTSIDDFGTGYSSLSYLQTLPVDTLKIDKSFIDRIASSNNDLQICRSIIQLATSLDKNLIAEGVQSEVQKDLLQKEGCHIIQGYLYSEAKPITEIINMLQDGVYKHKTKIKKKEKVSLDLVHSLKKS